MQNMRSTVRVSRGRLVAALAWALACAGGAGLVPSLAAGATTSAVTPGALTPVKQPASATMEACVTEGEQAERSATFVGEMSAVPGTARMQMRVEILEHTAGEIGFHAVTYPGIGAWLHSSPGVKTYKGLDKVTDLAAPAVYRAAIHFRWLNARGRPIKVLDLRTPRCVQPADAATETTPTGSAPRGPQSP